MKNNKIYQLIFAVFLLLPAPALFAGPVDSSVELPPMTVAVQASKTAGKAYGDYQSLRKTEKQIFDELTSPEFERLPRSEREPLRAEKLVKLGQLARQQNAALKTYKVHLSNAIAAFGEVGPSQIGAAQSRLGGIRNVMIGEIDQQTITAGALADAGRLGGLTPKQKKEFRDHVKQLKRKQAMELQVQASGRKLADAGATVEAIIAYMEEVKTGIDVTIIGTEANIALNTGAKAVHIVKEMSRRLCGEEVCVIEKMFNAGPDHSQLLGGFNADQPATADDDKTTDEYIDTYARR